MLIQIQNVNLMKKIEALKVILVWWAYSYALGGEDNLLNAYDWFTDEVLDHRIPQAILVWFGTNRPIDEQLNLFLKVWGDIIKNELLDHFPEYALGNRSLDDLIHDNIL